MFFSKISFLLFQFLQIYISFNNIEVQYIKNCELYNFYTTWYLCNNPLILTCTNCQFLNLIVLTLFNSVKNCKIKKTGSEFVIAVTMILLSYYGSFDGVAFFLLFTILRLELRIESLLFQIHFLAIPWLLIKHSVITSYS